MNSLQKNVCFAVYALCVIAASALSGCGKSEATRKPAEARSRSTLVDAASNPQFGTEKNTLAEFVEVDMGTVLPPMKVPSDNPMTPEKIELGRKLFFDEALSADRSMSCATCHDPEMGWSNGQRFAEGASGIRGKRNTLSILNVGFYDRYLFWDGRVKTLEQQALIPVFEPEEMGMSSEQELLVRLQSDSEYQDLFESAFEDGITVANVAKALATFQRTIFVKEIAYDRYLAGDKSILSDSAIRGERVFFRSQASCGVCHPAPLFTDHKPYNIGIGMDSQDPDLGFHHTLQFANWGKFRSPSLRGINQTGPYMHDGSLATLEDVVDYYNKGGIRHKYTDVGVRSLRLSDRQKKDLVAFLREALREIKEDE